MGYEVRIEQQAGQPLAVVRRRASKQELSKVVPEACGTVWSELKSHHVAGAGRHVAVYWDGVINLEVGVEIGDLFQGAGEVVASRTPGGSIAKTTHFGPYALLHLAHEAIQSWCNDNDLTLAGPSWEIYGHWTDEWNRDPAKIRTDICYLLATASP